MKQRPLTLLEPTTRAIPLVVDSPHSGRYYPDDFIYACPLSLLRQAEDFLVDELIAGASLSGATVITAEFPRSYIDVNRAENDLDPNLLRHAPPVPLDPSERTLMGLGLVRRLCKSGLPVYTSQLDYGVIEHRLHNVHRPYHAALSHAMNQHHTQFGIATLINAHSMPSRAERADRQHPDFVLGDRDGTSAAPWLIHAAQEALRAMGYTVWCNDPFKGVEILRRHGRPDDNRHALQLEINRGLYMNEVTLEKTRGFDRLRDDMTAFFQSMAATITQTLSQSIAAE